MKRIVISEKASVNLSEIDWNSCPIVGIIRHDHKHLIVYSPDYTYLLTDTMCLQSFCNSNSEGSFVEGILEANRNRAYFFNDVKKAVTWLVRPNLIG
jgi:hypothetical protein